MMGCASVCRRADSQRTSLLFPTTLLRQKLHSDDLPVTSFWEVIEEFCCVLANSFDCFGRLAHGLWSSCEVKILSQSFVIYLRLPSWSSFMAILGAATVENCLWGALMRVDWVSGGPGSLLTWLIVDLASRIAVRQGPGHRQLIRT